MEKKTYQSTLERIGRNADLLFSDVASIRTLLKEINQKASLTQLSYKMLLNLVDLKLQNVSQSLLDLSIEIDHANEEPTIDQEPEVTENDLPFQ